MQVPPQARKVAIVTGASQGIGAGIAPAFGHAGYAVVATSRSIEPSGAPDVVTVDGDIADASLARRRDGSMPYDGAWADEHTLFEAWIAARKAPDDAA